MDEKTKNNFLKDICKLLEKYELESITVCPNEESLDINDLPNGYTGFLTIIDDGMGGEALTICRKTKQEIVDSQPDKPSI